MCVKECEREWRKRKLASFYKLLERIFLAFRVGVGAPNENWEMGETKFFPSVTMTIFNSISGKTEPKPPLFPFRLLSLRLPVFTWLKLEEGDWKKWITERHMCDKK